MFELRKTARDREQQLSMRRPHVDVEIRDMHADTGFAQPVEFVERIPCVAEGAVDVPDDKDVAGAQLCHDACIYRADTRHRRELFDIELVADMLQPIDLTVRPLFGGGNAQISDPLLRHRALAFGSSR